VIRCCVRTLLSEKDWLSGAMQTAESRVGEGSDSPTARACKTGMQKLRGLFIKGSKGRLRGDGNDEEAMAGKRGTLEYNEEEEAMEEISDLPEINRSGSKPFGSGWGPASPATPRGLLGGAQPVARDASLEHHAPPEWVVTYVRLLRGRPLRWFFLLLWLSLTLSGASIYFPLTRILKISVEPPYGSESEAAKITYAENFPPEPVTLVALLSTNQRNAPNQTLINADAEMQLELLPPFFSYNPEGDLTAETESISLDLKKRVQPYLELVEWPADVESGQQAGEASAERGGTSVRASGVPAPPPSPAQLKPKCEFNFYSFFDMPFEVQMVAHSFLFPSNFGGQEGMIAVHLVSCYGHAIYKECVYKHEWFCEPVHMYGMYDMSRTRPRHVRDMSRTGRRAPRVLGGLPRVEDGGVPRVAGRAAPFAPRPWRQQPAVRRGGGAPL